MGSNLKAYLGVPSRAPSSSRVTSPFYMATFKGNPLRSSLQPYLVGPPPSSAE